MKHRLLLCLLLCGLMLYIAVPRLQVGASGSEGVFAVLWLALLLFAGAGNLAGLLYAPARRKSQKSRSRQNNRERSYDVHR